MLPASAAVRFDPDDARNHSALGFARLWARDVSGARAQLEHARVVNPADPDILADLADTLVYASKPNEALAVLDTACELNPYGYDQFAWLGAGARYSLHDYRGVIETAARMTDASELDRLVAASHAQLGEHSEARAHAKRVLERNPRLPRLGLVRQSTGQRSGRGRASGGRTRRGRIAALNSSVCGMRGGRSRMPKLKDIRLLEGLSRPSLERIAQRCRWSGHAAGETVIQQADRSNDVYFLTAGKAKAVLYSAGGKAVAFRDIDAGDTFGELAALDGAPRSASIEAIEACTLASLTAADFWSVLDTEPEMRRRMFRQLVAHVRSLSDRVYEFSTFAVANRIQAELLRLSRGGERADGSAVVTPHPKHGDIAERISTHREAVAREFSRLRELGLIDRQGDTLVIRDTARLTRMVAEATEE